MITRNTRIKALHSLRQPHVCRPRQMDSGLGASGTGLGSFGLGLGFAGMSYKSSNREIVHLVLSYFLVLVIHIVPVRRNLPTVQIDESAPTLPFIKARTD